MASDEFGTGAARDHLPPEPRDILAWQRGMASRYMEAVASLNAADQEAQTDGVAARKAADASLEEDRETADTLLKRAENLANLSRAFQKTAGFGEVHARTIRPSASAVSAAEALAGLRIAAGAVETQYQEMRASFAHLRQLRSYAGRRRRARWLALGALSMMFVIAAMARSTVREADGRWSARQADYEAANSALNAGRSQQAAEILDKRVLSVGPRGLVERAVDGWRQAGRSGALQAWRDSSDGAYQQAQLLYVRAVQADAERMSRAGDWLGARDALLQLGPDLANTIVNEGVRSAAFRALSTAIARAPFGEGDRVRLWESKSNYVEGRVTVRRASENPCGGIAYDVQAFRTSAGEPTVNVTPPSGVDVWQGSPSPSCYQKRGTSAVGSIGFRELPPSGRAGTPPVAGERKVVITTSSGVDLVWMIPASSSEQRRSFGGGSRVFETPLVLSNGWLGAMAIPALVALLLVGLAAEARWAKIPLSDESRDDSPPRGGSGSSTAIAWGQWKEMYDQ